ncbi:MULTISPECIES: BrnA antitoxin family protein [unclassified Moorena]|uniref:BrnA antitoxin family protein n=1 Tax=unclassified Moorena TaxID=2683338 RepID=UPI0013B96F90|nr:MULTISPECIES: BrnA antitoxin family protein [unclassified Moorena]NEP35631.1 BrnA antitoxin family protein [Moorena sp. SIO3B2]NEQ07993.1 BrnA antitoxin family protein [Moorena sp. SIO4E2]NER86360.1 BrnA antitoxin family protein [Moorena sp. SIO3A2]NES44709.1 BrnA antitoxin family protein [Moorena sp. SIO2C4]
MRKEYDFSKGKRGAVISSKGKTRITIYLDDEILANFREQAETAGIGYQTLINEALKKHLQCPSEQPLTQGDLRRILREELSVRSRSVAYGQSPLK